MMDSFRRPGVRSVSLFMLILFLPAAALALPGPGDFFVTTWDTTKPGDSSNTSITVPMVGGTYGVDWDNDGSIDESNLTGSVTHDFGAAGQYTVRIWGNYDGISFANGGDREKILSVDQWGTNTWTTMSQAFEGATNLEVPAADVPNFASVTSMFNMFKDAPLANPITSNWDTTMVQDMGNMFSGATAANPDTSNWNTANVVSMGTMFAGATSANPDTSNWQTGKVNTTSFMFAGASSANPDTSGWDVSGVLYMAGMFQNTTIANPDTSNWVTSSVNNTTNMFSGAEAANPDVSSWDTTNLTVAASMFYRAPNANPNVSGWAISALTDASFMFDGAALSRENYESLLLGWSAQTVNAGVTLHAGDATYCGPAATAARNSLVNGDGWTITDGGECPPTIFEDAFIQ